ncbi:MRC1-like domain-containing protein [Lipomyces starkeyi]
MSDAETTSTTTARPALTTSLFPESDAESSIASSPTKTPSRQLSRNPDDNEERMLTPRSRVRRLLSGVAGGSEKDFSGDDGEAAGSASDTSSTDHEIAVPRKKGGLAALLKKRSSTTEYSDSAKENTAASSYESVRRKMLMQLAKGKTPTTTSPKNSSSAIEDATRSARDIQDDDSDKENRGPRSPTRPRKSTAIGPFQLDSMFSDDRDGDSDNDGAAVSVTPTKKGMSARGKDLSELEMSDSDNDNHNTPALARTGKHSFDEFSTDDDDDFDDDDGVDNLRDLLHDKTFTNNIRRKREERLAVEAKKRAAEEMRKAQEKERIRLELELERERLLEVQLAKKRTTRKASKKALEEMNKETARIQRNRQLALQPVTVNKISKESLFAKFNFNPSAFLDTGVPNSSSSQAAGSDTVSTPPSSPLQDSRNANESGPATHPDPNKKLLEQQNLPTTTDLDSDSDLDSDDSGHKIIGNTASVRDLIKSTQEKKKAAVDREKGKLDRNLKKLHPNSTTPVKHDLTVLRAQLPEDTLYMIKSAKAKSAGLVEKAIVHLSDNDSDSDLEILPPGQASAKKSPRKKVTLENVKVSARKEMPLWRRLTAYKSPSKALRKRGYMTDRELDEMLQARIREQARKETEEKQAEILAKGGKILSAEEKKKEEEIIEDLLERERRNAEETRKREKRERRRNGEVDDEENFVDEEDDDEDDEDDEDEYEEEDIAELLSDEAEEDVDDDDESEKAADDHDDTRDEPVELVEDEPGLTQFFQPSQTDGDNMENIHGNEELLQVKTPPLLQLPPRNPDSSPMFPSSSELKTSRSKDQSDAYNDDLSPNITKSKRHYSSPELNRHLTGADAESSTAVTSFSKMLKAQGKQDKLVRRLKKSRIMKEMFDEHAEESDDEWKGVGGASDPDSEDDDEYDSELDAMVNDNVDENADRARVAALFAADELDRDEKLVNEMIKGVHGGFRKRHKGGLYDLSDSDDEAAYAERRRQRREAKRRKHLLKDEKMSSLAENPKARAFFKTIEEDERRLAEPQYVDIDDLEALLNA